MAGRGAIKGITIEIGADATKFKNAFSQIDKTVKGTSASLRDINKLLKLDPTNTTLLKQKQTELKRAIEETKNKIQLEKDALAKLKDADQTPEVVRQQEALQREIIEDERKLKSLEKEFKSFGSVAKQQMLGVSEKVRETGEKLSAIGSSIASLGRSMTMRVTTPIVAGFGAAVKATSEFDAEMSKVQALTGKIDASGLEELTAVADQMGIAYSENADMSAQALEILRNKARQVASETQYDANEVAEAYSYMALAGWDATEMVQGISGVMDLAAASGEELGRVSDIVTDGLTAFGYSAQDTGRFVDVLAQTMSKSNTTVDMMGEAFKYVAPVAGSLGYSVEDVSLALGLMANSGIKAGTAGTTLRNILTNMTKPTDEMQLAMDRLGITLEDGEGGLLSFKQVMDNLRTGFKDLKIPVDEFENQMGELDAAFEDGAISEKEYDAALDELITRSFGAEGAIAAQTAAMLAGKRGMSGLLAIVNSSEEEYNALTDSIYNSTGAAEEMRKVMMDNLTGDFKTLMSNVKELGITFADILIPHLRDVVAKIQEFIQWLQNLSPEQQELIVKIAAVAAAIGPVLLIVAGLIKVISGVVLGISGVIKVLALVANPIGLVVTAIAALVAGFMYLWNTSDGFREFWIGLWEAIQSAVSTAVEWIKGAVEPIGEVWDGLVEAVSSAWETIQNVVTVAIMLIGEILSAAVQILLLPWTFIWENCKDVLIQAFEAIKTAVSTAVEFLKSIITTGLTIIRTVFSTIWNAVVAVVSAAWDGIKNVVTPAINAVKTTITTVLNAIKAVFSSIWNAIRTVVSTVWEAIRSKIDSVINAVKSTVSDGLESVKKTATDILESVKKKFTDTFDNIKKHVDGVVEWLKKCFNFEWSLPKIKLPHFSISGGFSLNPPSVPSFSIEWYKKAYDNAMLFKSPTIIPTVAGFKGFGDGNGAEMVIGQENLMSSISKASGATELVARLDIVTGLLMEYLPEMADTNVYLDKNVLVGQIAPAMNRQLGLAFRG